MIESGRTPNERRRDFKVIDTAQLTREQREQNILKEERAALTWADTFLARVPDIAAVEAFDNHNPVLMRSARTAKEDVGELSAKMASMGWGELCRLSKTYAHNEKQFPGALLFAVARRIVALARGETQKPVPSPEHAAAIEWARDTVAMFSNFDAIASFNKEHDPRLTLPIATEPDRAVYEKNINSAREHMRRYDLEKAIRWQQTQDGESPAFDPIAALAMAERILALSENYDLSGLDPA